MFLSVVDNVQKLLGAILGRRKAPAWTRAAQSRRRRAAVYNLPTETDSLEEFAERAARILVEPDTLIFIDTSFLMWMIKIGTTARAELIAWIEGVAGDRLHVPVWSAHELYRHHADNTVKEELDATLNALEEAAKKALPVMWPLLNEPLDGAPSGQTQRNQARDTLREMRAMVANVRKWASSYQRQAKDVIDFINRHALPSSCVFDDLERIEDVAAARFTGRIPPGFHDRKKSEITIGQEPKRTDRHAKGDDVSIGSNRWGDLIFWQEILDIARNRRAAGVVILTKDVKNDWRMAGAIPVRTSETGEHGEAPAHPMLVYEAARQAGIRDLLLLDHRRVAAIVECSNVNATALSAAAQAPPSTTPKREGEERCRDIGKAAAVRTEIRATEARDNGVRFLDREGLIVSKPRLLRALVETEGAKLLSVQGTAVLIAAIERAAGEGNSLEAVITENALAPLDHIGLVAVGRYFGLEAITRPAMEPAANELAAMLSSLPSATASAFYFGLIAAMYLERDSNAFRTTPRSAVAGLLFGQQGEAFADLPISTLNGKATRAERLPLYLLNPEKPAIPVRMQVDGDLEMSLALRAIWIYDSQLLTSAQGDLSLQLETRLNGAPATPDLLLDHVAELYGLPRAQLVAETDVTTSFGIQEFWGFKDPRLVFSTPIRDTE